MKVRLLTIVALTVFLAAPAVAQKVYIDWDNDVDFSALETFAWKETGQPSLEDGEPLMHKHIVDGIISRLETAGLTKSDDPDFFITYHGESDTEVRVDTTSMGYGYGRGWRWGYAGPSTSRAYTYESGTLIIDAWDGKTQQLIWRGTASRTFSDKPDKARKQIDKAINKIVKKWDKEYRKK